MAYKVLGTCDNVTTCDCCGKDNLKRTVALDNGYGVSYFGTTCAAKATKHSSRYVAWQVRKAPKGLLSCEECTTCSDEVRRVGMLGRVLCFDCVDSHHAAQLGYSSWQEMLNDNPN